MVKKDPESKCVVFSQFPGVLDVCAAELLDRGIGIVRIDGTTKQHERADALHEFATNPTVRAFLFTMRDGAVGLTLTAADHCFLMDVAQSSAIEEQAIDRIHRYVQSIFQMVGRVCHLGTTLSQSHSVSVRATFCPRSIGQTRPVFIKHASS